MYPHHTILDRLTHGVDRSAVKLSKLVQKQHSSVCERKLSRPLVSPSAYQRCRRYRVMRTSERPLLYYRHSFAQNWRNTVYPCDLKLFFICQLRQYRRYALCKHRLPAARIANQQYTMSAGCPDHDSSFSKLLSYHLRKITVPYSSCHSMNRFICMDRPVPLLCARSPA